ncbi:MAG TPA: DUF4157 domain-containing protein, partial [Myxococcota bacterium]|nr:DUF4157 domain-containing protein [Myxococcota bacterium]
VQRTAPQVAPSSSPVPRELRGGAAIPAGQASRDLSGGNPQVPGLRFQKTGSGKGLSQSSAVQQAFSGPKQEVPHRREMESAFGQSFSDVRAYTGAKANQAAEGMGASAFTLGTDVAFQSANPSKQTVAHELTHVVQQRNGTETGLRRQSADTGDSLEQEAEEVGRKVAEGKAAVVSGQDGPTLRKEELRGTPREVRNSTTFQPLTTHAMPTLADTVETRATPAAPAQSNDAQNVSIVSGINNKLDVGVDACPFPGLIYGVGPAESPAPHPYTPVNGIVGSVTAPIVDQQPDPALYIGGRPSADDVHQMSIGDCYFLSTLMSLATRDPGQITSMMTPDGKGGATVRLYRVVVESSWLGLCKTRKFVPVDVKVDGKLDFWGPTRVSNGHGGFQLRGAQLHAATHPCKAEWYSKFEGDKLEVHRDERWEVARWAPLLEKAFALYAETYTQYGDSTGTNEKSGNTIGAILNGTSGYEIISSGVPYYVLPVIYGASADHRADNVGEVGRSNISWTPGSQNLAENWQALDRLVLLQGQGTRAGGLVSHIITANSFVDPLISRLQAAIIAAAGDPDWNNLSLAERQNLIAVLMSTISFQWTPANPEPAKKTARAAVGTACSTAVNPANAPNLLATTRSPALVAMLDLLLDLKNIGTDNSPGQRNIYGDHSYSVVAVNLITTTGIVPDYAGMSAIMRRASYGLLDPNNSIITLRNPHHNNEPDANGQGLPRRAGDGPTTTSATATADGTFTMTLAQFLRNINAVDSGSFYHFNWGQ